MKIAKNSNILLVGLALLLSLVSFTGVSNRTPNEAVKTALVISDYGTDIRSITYKNALKDNSDAFTNYYEFAFTEALKHQGIKENTLYKTYIHKTLGIKTEQLHTKCFSLSAHQTLYNAIV